jgi:hypothetical protein
MRREPFFNIGARTMSTTNHTNIEGRLAQRKILEAAALWNERMAMHARRKATSAT